MGLQVLRFKFAQKAAGKTHKVSLLNFDHDSQIFTPMLVKGLLNLTASNTKVEIAKERYRVVQKVAFLVLIED